MKVYVAGSSNDLERVRAAQRRLRVAGAEISFDWTLDIELARVSGKTDADLSEPQRAVASIGCLDGVRLARVFWLLAPPAHAPSRGAWGELGYAIALAERDPNRTILVSGPGARETIFTSHPLVTSGDDASVAEFLERWARRGRAVPGGSLHETGGAA